MDSLKRIHKKGLRNAVIASLLLVSLVLLGSRRLLYFDAALIPYLFATVFALMAVVYRYSVWLDRPPTRRLWSRSWRYLFHWDFFPRFFGLVQVFFKQLVLQQFIEQRSFYRWLMHFSIGWGTIIAFLVTFPLVFGWFHFGTVPGFSQIYQLYAFGFPQMTFSPTGILGFLFFNALNIAAVLVVLGTVMAFTRRILHPGVVSGQTFTNDMLPLLILFAVAITGAFLTYSARFMGGDHFRTISTLHCFTVVIFLVYLPFGKFFHIFQRGALLGAAIYIREKKAGRSALCLKCGNAYVSQIQQNDVKLALEELGFRYSKTEGPASIQDLCPACRRRLFMFNQQREIGGGFDQSQKESIHG